MVANTKIEWTDHTLNPWIGCQKVGPGCDHCYAEAMMDKRLSIVQWGPGAERKRTSVSTWRTPLSWDKKHAEFFALHGRRQRVFCASLADVFDNEVPDQWRRDLFDLIELTPNLDWLLLTKRIGNVRDMITRAKVSDWLAGRRNVWLGASIVNQAEADRDIPKLLALPARVRFLSMEPLLGPVDLRFTNGLVHGCDAADYLLDWVIVGGESGPDARPIHPDWARSLRDQCAADGVPFLFKQWGEWAPGECVERKDGTVHTAKRLTSHWLFSKEDLAETEGHADDEPDLYRVGKKAAGRRLDGVEHNGFPEFLP